MNTVAERAESTTTAHPHRLFAYEPKAPRVPGVEGCGYQRWFDDDRRTSVGGHIYVWRSDADNVCAVSLSVDSVGVSVNAGVKLTPAQLRALAARLLRAADDIEAHPAARAAEGGEA